MSDSFTNKQSNKFTKDFEQELKTLSPEQKLLFFESLQLLKKRKYILLIGYLLALMSLFLGIGMVFYMYAGYVSGSFSLTLFLIPIGTALVIIMITNFIVKHLKPKRRSHT